jgi:uncharacterized protein YqcC (DUF446 family)
LDPGDDGLRVDGLGSVNVQGRADVEWSGRAPPALPFIVREQFTVDRMAWMAWLDRLVSALKRIVENLSDATSFSISVRSNVSVTVDFGRLDSSSA